MTKRDMNSIGPHFLEYLKDNTKGLSKHLMKDDKNKDLVVEKITQDKKSSPFWWIQPSLERYTLSLAGGFRHHLNFENPMDYTSWSEVPTKEREPYYRSYNGKGSTSQLEN